MSTIHSLAWRNGATVPTADIRLSPLQTGLLTGWGLFSTLRIYQGVPFALEEHIARLEHDGRRLRVELDGLGEQLRRGFAALIEANQAREAMARIYCIRNHGGLFDAPGQRPTDIMIFTGELRAWGTSARLRVQPFGRCAAGPLAGTKTLTWSHNLVLVEEAHEQGYDDVLLLNERGEVAECTAANIFVVRDGVAATPPLASGALPGVSRKVLLEAAAGPAGRRAGLRLAEATLREPDLDAAEEVFITSSTREVQPVTRIGARALLPGPQAARAAALFRTVVEEYVAARLGREAAAR